MIRYVGKANNPRKRLWNHVSIHPREKGYKTNWISGLKKNGLRPVMDIVEEVDESEWESSERFWISYFRFLGFSLMNIDLGGNGAHKVSDSMREKCRLIHLGKRRSEEVRAKLREVNKGRVWSDESRKKLSASLIGKKKGMPMHPNALKALMAYHTGRKQTPEEIENRASKIRGVKRKNPPSEKLMAHMRKMWAARKEWAKEKYG